MKMSQIVYVVMNSESATIYGVYNDESDAIAVATETWANDPEVTITPILVDARPVNDNKNCECVEELRDSVDDIFEWVRDEAEEVYDLGIVDEYEDEDEEEDEDEDEDYGYSDEYEDEDEDDDKDNTLRAAIDIVINALRDALDDLED